MAAAPTLAADQLYQLELKAQSEVTFLAPPGKKRGDGGAYAGLAGLTVDTAGVVCRLNVRSRSRQKHSQQQEVT
jgi:hypothetical protein